jgi:stress response protein SCP2
MKKSLKEVFTNILCINEAFDTKFDSVKWNLNGHIFKGDAKLGTEEFKLYIQVQSFNYSQGSLTWLNVAFSRIVDGDENESLLNMGNQSKQLGAVISALKDKVKSIVDDYQVDAVVFIANAGEEKRISLYEKLAHSSKLGLHNWRYLATTKWSSGQAVIMSEKTLSVDDSKALKAELEKHGKSLITK